MEDCNELGKAKNEMNTAVNKFSEGDRQRVEDSGR